MQSLQLKFKNVPTSTPLACSSTNPTLNSLETDSEQDKVLDCNNPEVDQPVHSPGLKVTKTVFVLSKQDDPLMLCTVTKAKHLLKKGKANVVKLNPFVIKLNFTCENKVQKVTLGIDAGYKTIGFSAVTNKEEILLGGLVLDDKTSKRLIKKKMYRRNRRYRLRYRKPRFNNRKKPEGWLSPSIQRRFNTHIRLINFLKSILPIEKVVIEVGKFDIQKIMNPDIQGIEYQQGSLYGFEDIRAYLMHREKGCCQICKGKINGEAHAHHIIQRKDGGTDRIDGLALVHSECHKKIHSGEIKIKFKPVRMFKAETYMSIAQKRFKAIPEYTITHGWKTAVKRRKLLLEKTHYNDAFVIAGGVNQARAEKIIEIEQRRKNNRGLQKNKKRIGICIRRKRYRIQPLDYIWMERKRYMSGGTLCKGSMVYCYKDGRKGTVSYKRVEKVYHTGSLVWKN